MKKFILFSFAATLIGCTNPSMDEGFEKLMASLSEVQAALEPIVSSIRSDMADITSTMEEITATVEEMNDDQAAAMATMAEIRTGLNRIDEGLEKAATKEEMEAFAAEVKDFKDDVDLLVFISDYDHDGIINGMDECPDTPPMEINNVDAKGCSPSQSNN